MVEKKQKIYFIYLNKFFYFRFVDPVAQDIVSIKSFDGRWEVSTFRTIGTDNFFIYFSLLICGFYRITK